MGPELKLTFEALQEIQSKIVKKFARCPPRALQGAAIHESIRSLSFTSVTTKPPLNQDCGRHSVDTILAHSLPKSRKAEA